MDCVGVGFWGLYYMWEYLIPVLLPFRRVSIDVPLFLTFLPPKLLFPNLSATSESILSE